MMSGVKRQRSAAVKFATMAARFAVCLLECAYLVNGVAPSVVNIFKGGVIYTLASAHRSHDYGKLNLIRVCRISYWVWIATVISDVIKITSEPMIRYLWGAIHQLDEQ